MVQNVPQQQDHHQSRLRRLMSAPTIEAIAQTVEEVGKEHASSTGQGPKTDHNAQAAIGTWSSAWRHLRETMRSLFEPIKRLGQGLNLPGEDKPFSVPTPDVVPAGGADAHHDLFCAPVYAFGMPASAPSCCMREKRLATPQCSVILPSRTRITSTVSNWTLRPVGAMPKNSPLCVPW